MWPHSIISSFPKKKDITLTQRSSPPQLAQMHKHTVSASSDIYVPKFLQLFRKNSVPERAQERMWLNSYWAKGGSDEEVVSGRSCSIFLCQLLMPQMWTALVNTSSASSIHSAQLPGTHIWATNPVFGTIICTPTHTSLDGVFTFHQWIRYRIKAF